MVNGLVLIIILIFKNKKLYLENTRLNLNNIIQYINETIINHEIWALPIVLFLSIGESLAFISLLLPATIILLALGIIIGESGISFWPIWFIASVGAFIGDWLSYCLGKKYKNKIFNIWPLSKNPELFIKGYNFFKKWGVLSIFLSRFFGPLRAVVPMIGGIFMMPIMHFQLANIISAMIWAFGILSPGAFGIQWLKHFF